MTNISHFKVPTVVTGSIICANKITIGLMAAHCVHSGRDQVKWCGRGQRIKRNRGRNNQLVATFHCSSFSFCSTEVLVKITTLPLWQFTADYSIDYKVVDRVTDRWRWRCVELRSVTFAGERWRVANFVMQSNKSTFSFRSFDVKLGGFDVDPGRSASLLPVRIFTCGYRQFGKKKLFDRKCRSYHH